MLADGSPTARSTPRFRSSWPPNGSRSSPVDGEYAIALIVKSRRARSSSSDTPNSTTACRPSCLHVATERRDLVHDAGAIEHTHGAELDAMRHGAIEQRPHLRRRGGGGEVPVGVRLAEERVAHGAAHAPRLEAGLGQPGRDLQHGRRRVQALLAARAASSGSRQVAYDRSELSIPDLDLSFTRTGRSRRSR